MTIKTSVLLNWSLGQRSELLSCAGTGLLLKVVDWMSNTYWFNSRIVVVLDTKVYVYNFADLQLLHQIETSKNPKGTLFGILVVSSLSFSCFATSHLYATRPLSSAISTLFLPPPHPYPFHHTHHPPLLASSSLATSRLPSRLASPHLCTPTS